MHTPIQTHISTHMCGTIQTHVHMSSALTLRWLWVPLLGDSLSKAHVILLSVCPAWVCRRALEISVLGLVENGWRFPYPVRSPKKSMNI